MASRRERDSIWEGGREGGREEGREGVRKGGKEEGGKKGKREGGREGGRESTVNVCRSILTKPGNKVYKLSSNPGHVVA